MHGIIADALERNCQRQFLKRSFFYNNMVKKKRNNVYERHGFACLFQYTKSNEKS